MLYVTRYTLYVIRYTLYVIRYTYYIYIYPIYYILHIILYNLFTTFRHIVPQSLLWPMLQLTRLRPLALY